MKYLLALDQGTSSCRSIVFDDEGGVRSIAQRELTQLYPRPGWVEHDPREIWQAQLTTAQQALAQAGLPARAIAAIGIACQRETTVLWDRRSGEPLHHAIVWQDRRTAPLCERLRARPGLAEHVAQATGLRIDPYFSATKLVWLLDHVDGARAAALRGELAFGTIDSWLLWNLTGGRVHATDESNAARTMLFDIRQRRWDAALLHALEIPQALLPAVRPSSSLFGETDPVLLGEAIPVAGMAGDQQAALFGQACFRPGLAKNTFGTGCFLLMHTGGAVQRSAHGLLATCAAGPPDAPAYALEGSVFVGGAVVQWLRDGLRAIDSSAAVQALAESVPDAGGVMLVPAFTGLGAPYWQPHARGVIVGLTRGSTVAHIARAALESIAFQTAALLQAMNLDAIGNGGAAVSELRVDGGASVNDLLMQFQADLLGIPVVRSEVPETTALGAAWLAGRAAGVYRDAAHLESLWRRGRTFHPTLPRERAQERLVEWDSAVRQATRA